MFKPNKLRVHEGDFGAKEQPKYGDPFGTYESRLYGVYLLRNDNSVDEYLVDQSVIYDIGKEADKDNIYWFCNSNIKVPSGTLRKMGCGKYSISDIISGSVIYDLGFNT